MRHGAYETEYVPRAQMSSVFTKWKHLDASTNSQPPELLSVIATMPTEENNMRPANASASHVTKQNFRPRRGVPGIGIRCTQSRATMAPDRISNRCMLYRVESFRLSPIRSQKSRCLADANVIRQ